MQKQQPTDLVLIKLSELSEDRLRECAKLYCQIWREPPWNEDFWTEEGVLGDIRETLQKSLSRAFVAIFDGTIVGFTWGYGVSKRDLQNISGGDELDVVFETHQKVFYISELGVALQSRKYGVGKKLTKRLINIAKNSGFSAITLRTDINATPAIELYKSLGFEETSATDEKNQTRTYWLLVL